MSFRTIRCLVFASALGALSGCATNPVTGERQLALISESQELAIGRSAAAEVRRTLGLVESRPLQAYVQRVGAGLAKSSERPNLPWTFGVVDDPTPNAFALPGGYIFVTRGMMNLMNSEAELASVLGHEIGHVTARHAVEALSQQQLAQLGLGLGGIIFPSVQPFSNVLGAGLQLLFLKHGRDAERQADELGFRYALNHGYAMGEMADVFTALQRAGDESRSALPSWLNTHPGPAERIQQVRQRVAALPASERGSRVARAEYLDHLDGLAYGSDPRNGFFRDGVFFHPALRFRFDIPAEWNAQNLTDAVVAVSPRRDAAIQLTLAPDTAPAAAARRFISQGGIRVLRTFRQPVGRASALVSVFDASTDQGTVRGTVAHFAHGGRTYQLLGYTALTQFGRYQSVFERVIGSFATVTDPTVLGAQPQRVDIVRLNAPMTLAEFSRRYQSVVPVSELAVINQVNGPDARFEAGTLLKRVV